MSSLQDLKFKGSSQNLAVFSVCIFPFSPSTILLPFFFSLPLLSVFSSTPPSKGHSCLSLINAWHLVRQEKRETGVRGGTRRGGRMGAAHQSRRREVKKQQRLKSRVFGSGQCKRGEEGRGDLRSNHDLDSKTPRHNRQGLTRVNPLTPPTLLPSTSVKTITDRRGAAGGEGPCLGMVPPHHLSPPCVLCLASLKLTPSSCMQRWPSNLWKFLERELTECRGHVWINFCRGLLNSLQFLLSSGLFLLPGRQKTPKWNGCKLLNNIPCVHVCTFSSYTSVEFGITLKQ